MTELDMLEEADCGNRQMEGYAHNYSGLSGSSAHALARALQSGGIQSHGFSFQNPTTPFGAQPGMLQGLGGSPAEAALLIGGGVSAPGGALVSGAQAGGQAGLQPAKHWYQDPKTMLIIGAIIVIIVLLIIASKSKSSPAPKPKEEEI